MNTSNYLTEDSKQEYYLSLVIPVYNEEKRLGNSLPKVIDYFAKKEYKSEIIIVDDGSQDGTIKIVENWMPRNPDLRLIKNDFNRGKGYSVKKGMMNARGKFTFFSDADLSTPIEEITNLLFYLEDGYDVVIGSRALATSKVLVRQRWYRDHMGKVFGSLVRLLVVPGIMDSQCGFKGFRSKTSEGIFALQQLDGFCFDAEILFLAKKKGFTIKEMPVQWVNSVESKLNPITDSVKMFLGLLKIRWNDLYGKYDGK